MIKITAKEVVRYLLYILKRRPYKIRINNAVAKEAPILRESSKEFFFGYYDKCPESHSKVLFQEMNKGYVNIIVRDLVSKEEIVIGKSVAYNWQMGARVLWINSDVISYNDFDGERYVCKLYSLKDKKILKILPMAIMDINGGEYALGTNWQRLRSVDYDYSYFNLPVMNNMDFNNYKSDGIWIYDFKANKKLLLLSIEEILKCKGHILHEDGKHSVNHIMINPDGTGFMFIHRYKWDKKKFDRLMYYDFQSLHCLLDDPLQSHFNYVDNKNIMGYCGYGGEIGWFWINLDTFKVHKLDKLSEVHPKNGHPTIHGAWIIIDSYPDLSRMQSLIAYNWKTEEIKEIAEVYHDIKHHNYNRCDLHPRFTSDGNKVYFDSIYDGKRQLCSLIINL